MSNLFRRIAGFFSKKTLVGVDKTGNRYFSLTDELDGVMKEKRFVEFKGEQEPTSVPVEWICWLNGQRKKAPTPEEMDELEARRERVRLNVAMIKKEEEEKKAKEGKPTKKVSGPDLQNFIRNFPVSSEDGNDDKDTESIDASRFSEPTGTGPTYKPGLWQPPT